MITRADYQNIALILAETLSHAGQCRGVRLTIQEAAEVARLAVLCGQEALKSEPAVPPEA